jgi:hypothetical protein
MMRMQLEIEVWQLKNEISIYILHQQQ